MLVLKTADSHLGKWGSISSAIWVKLASDKACTPSGEHVTLIYSELFYNIQLSVQWAFGQTHMAPLLGSLNFLPCKVTLESKSLRFTCIHIPQAADSLLQFRQETKATIILRLIGSRCCTSQTADSLHIAVVTTRFHLIIVKCLCFIFTILIIIIIIIMRPSC